MWRKGPTDKPRLCNPCGVQYMTKKTLDGYMPGQKRGSRLPGDPPERKPKIHARPVKRKVVTPELQTTPVKATARDPVQRKPSDDQLPIFFGGSSRKRKQSKPQQAMPSTPQGRIKTNPAEKGASGLSQGSGVRRLSRDSFANAMKKPRLASVKVSIEVLAAGDDEAFDGEFATPSKRPPSGNGRTPPSSTKAGRDSGSILDQLPYRKRDVLYSIESPLAHIDLSDIVSHEVFKTLGEEEQAQMLRLLSPIDCSSSGGAACEGEGAEEEASSRVGEAIKAMFSSSQFSEWMGRYQTLLSAGMFDQAAPGLNPRVHEHFKKLLEDTDLNKSNWKESMPSANSSRRNRKDDAWKDAHYEGYWGEKKSAGGEERSGGAEEPAEEPVDAEERRGGAEEQAKEETVEDRPDANAHALTAAVWAAAELPPDRNKDGMIGPAGLLTPGAAMALSVAGGV